ncbi:MAG: CpaF/VirB11 family protein [Bacteriovoracaceae bacterium]
MTSRQIINDCLQKNFSRIHSSGFCDSYESLIRYFLENHTDLKESFQFFKSEVAQDWFSNLFSLSFIEDVFNEDPHEIILHSHQHIQFTTFNSSMEHTLYDLEVIEYNLSMEFLAIRHGQSFNYENPFCSFDGTLFGKKVRVTLIHSSTNQNHCHKAYIRIFKKEIFTLDQFTNSSELKDYLIDQGRSFSNILISGSTGSGKTSFLNSLLCHLNQEEHTVVIEDLPEIRTHSQNVSHLITRTGRKDDDYLNYCHYLLRMRPDRILLGEIRSSEVVPLILNLNNGHKGLMSTIHANSALDAIDRLIMLFCLYSNLKTIDANNIQELVCRNIDIIVHLEKGKIKEAIWLKGISHGRPFFENIIS